MFLLKLIFVAHVLVPCIIEVRAFLRFNLERFGEEDSQNKTRVGFITQWLDHFNPQDLRKWEMRYISNDEFFEAGGPIFIFLGGEWKIGGTLLTGGQIHKLAKQHKGYMFYTEHRFYGESNPTGDMSTENLKYLSIDQALADVVYFIQHMKTTVKGLQHSKVVVLGCSYSGTMATWIRLKYPHIIDVAYASSAPVKSVENFYEYLEVVSRSIALASQKCLQIASDGITQIHFKLLTEKGRLELSQKFNTHIKDIEEGGITIFEMIRIMFSKYVQYGGLYYTKNLCRLLEEHSGTSIDKLAFSILDNGASTGFAWNDGKKFNLQNTFPNDDKGWWYQVCTELGWFQTTTSDKQPFGNVFPLEYYINLCNASFGKGFDAYTVSQGIYRTKIFYGSNKPEVTKLISVHGDIDPWHPMGILEDLNPLAPAFLIKGSSHCYDIFQDWNTPELDATRSKIRNIISEWLK